MPNQRPPNSLHHENALLSDLVINETPKLRTQPIRAWHSRNERITPHIPAQAELPPQESGDDSTKQGGDAKTPIREIAFHQKNQKKTNLHRSSVPAYTHNLMTAFDISVELRHLFQKNWTDLGACFDHTHISQT